MHMIRSAVGLEHWRLEVPEVARMPEGILSAGSGNILVASSKDVLDRDYKMAAAGDLDGCDRYIDTGLVWFIKGGTKVMILSQGFSRSEVLVMEGESRNRKGASTTRPGTRKV